MTVIFFQSLFQSQNGIRKVLPLPTNTDPIFSSVSVEMQVYVLAYSANAQEDLYFWSTLHNTVYHFNLII